MARIEAVRVVRTRLARLAGQKLAPGRLQLPRPFHSTPVTHTDGVYKELTEMRVRTPWIQALKERKEAEKHSDTSIEQSIKPDLTPKRMQDSYVSLVLPLSVSTSGPVPLLRLPTVDMCRKTHGCSTRTQITRVKSVPEPCSWIWML